MCCSFVTQDICFIWIVGIFSLCSQISILSSSTRFTSIRQVFEIFMRDSSSEGACGLLKFNGSSKLFRGAVKILHNNVCVQKWRENDIKFSFIPRSNNWEMKLGDQGSHKLLPRVGVWIPILYSWNIASHGWGPVATGVFTPPPSQPFTLQTRRRDILLKEGSSLIWVLTVLGMRHWDYIWISPSSLSSASEKITPTKEIELRLVGAHPQNSARQ